MNIGLRFGITTLLVSMVCCSFVLIWLKKEIEFRAVAEKVQSVPKGTSRKQIISDIVGKIPSSRSEDCWYRQDTWEYWNGHVISIVYGFGSEDLTFQMAFVDGEPVDGCD